MRIRLLTLFLLALATTALASVPASVYFVENEGQWDGAFRFRAGSGQGASYITETGLVLDLQRPEKTVGKARDRFMDPGMDRRPEPRRVQGHVLRLTFLAADPCPVLVGQAKLASYSNYFLGRDSSRWKSRVGHYQRVLSQQVWPGIDVEYVLTPAGVELVYHLQAGADPAQIQIQIEGLQAPLALDAAGNLILPTSLGLLVEQAPSAFQNGRAIPCRYRLSSDSTYRFELEGCDPSQELLIDPLLYSTFLGGDAWESFDQFQLDPRDQTLVVAGNTVSATFPLTPGAYQDTLHGGDDGFVTRFTADGRALLFSTYLGGGNSEQILCLALTPTSEIYVGGYTFSTDWPLTADAPDTTFIGYFEGCFSRLSEDGTTLAFSSYWGGSSMDYLNDLKLDSTGLVYLYGRTHSSDFLITPGALFPEYQGYEPAYISIFNPATPQVLYSTYFPGTADVYAWDIAVIAPWHVWITGSTNAGGIVVTPDALQPDVQYNRPTFLSKLNLLNGVVDYSSYFGGNGDTHICYLQTLQDNRLLLVGNTHSSNFPVTAGTYDTTQAGSYSYKVFVTFLQLPATVVRSTLFGMRHPRGTFSPSAAAIVPADSSVVICGIAQGSGFPTTPGTLDSVTGPEWPDACVVVLSADLSTLRYSTLMGGIDMDHFYGVQVGADNTVWLAGASDCPDFPVTEDAYQHAMNGWGDAVLCRFDLPWIIAAANNPPPLPPSSFHLSVFPNPFNSTTTLCFTLPVAATVSVHLFDLLGRDVQSVDLGKLEAGEHVHRCSGDHLASGIYFASVTAGSQRRMTKLALVR